MRMREALGLGGRRDNAPPRQPVEQSRPAPHRPASDRPAGSGHRHRFVQDGEVPVVLVNHAGGPNSLPSVARGTEPRTPNPRSAAHVADLSAERAARERAERQSQQAQAMIRDLETKLAHAEIARSEAISLAKSEKALVASVREECRGMLNSLREELAGERAARERAENALRDALATRVEREIAPRPHVELPPKKTSRKRSDLVEKPLRAARRAVAEPKPVKWWVKGRSAKA